MLSTFVWPQQELHSPRIPGAPVVQGRLGPSQGVSSEILGKRLQSPVSGCCLDGPGRRQGGASRPGAGLGSGIGFVRFTNFRRDHGGRPMSVPFNARNMYRASLLLSWCIATIGLSLPNDVTAATISHWRFEGGDFFSDSAGTSELTLNGDVQQVTVPNNGRGGNFPLGSRAADFDGSNQSFLRTTIAPLHPEFTIEAFVNADSFAGGNHGDQIVAVRTSDTAPNRTAFGLQVRHDRFGGTSPGELFMSLGAGNAFVNVASGLVLETSTDYYVGAAVSTTSGFINFFVQDLTNSGPLTKSSRTHRATSVNPITTLSIGDSVDDNTNFAFDGLIDEVRLTSGILSEPELLPTVVPIPSALWLLAGALVFVLPRRRVTSA